MTDVNPFDALDDVVADGPVLTQDEPTLFERFYNNYEQGYYSGTVAGAIKGKYSDAFDKQRATDRYDALPQWETPLEAAAALAGQLAGAASSPENLIPVTAGARMLAWTGMKMPAVAARFLGGAIDAGVTNLATDAAIQQIEIGSGQRDEFSGTELAASAGLGAVVGGTTNTLVRGKTIPEIGDPASVLPPSAAPTKIDVPASSEPPLIALLDSKGVATAQFVEPRVIAAEGPALGDLLDARARQVRELGPSTVASGDPLAAPVETLMASTSEPPASALEVPIPHEVQIMEPVRVTVPEALPDIYAVPIKEATIAVRDYAREMFAGKSVLRPDGETIAIPWQGIKHALSGTKTREALAATTKLDEILQRGIHAAEVPDTGGRGNIKSVHYYDAQVIAGNQPVVIRAVVREALDGRRYYDHFAIVERGGSAPGEGRGQSLQDTGGAPSQGKPADGTLPTGDPEDKLAASPGSRQGAIDRTAGGVGGMGQSPEFTRVKDISERLAKALEAPTVRSGRVSAKVGGKAAGGQYGVKSGVIRVAKPDDFDVLAHELGHHVEAAFGAPMKALMQAHAGELTPLAYAGAKSGHELQEGFAEFMRMLATNPAYAAKVAPQFDAALKAFLAKEGPDVLAAIDEAAAAWRAWNDQPSADAVASTIVSGMEPKYFAKARKDLDRYGLGRTIGDRLSRSYTMLFDDLNPIAKAVGELAAIYRENTGKALDLKVSEDPYKLARLSRGAWNAGHMDISHGVTPYRATAPVTASLRDALVTAMGKPNVLSGWDDEMARRFGAYLWSRRALGEWDRFDAGDIPNPPDKLTRADHAMNVAESEKAFPGFAGGARMVHDWASALWAKKRDAGLITQEQWAEGMAIKDYVPGLRAFDQAGDAKAGGRGAPSAKTSMVKRFRGSRRDVINPVESLMADAYETAMAIARNDVVKQLDRLALLAGPGGGAIAERVPSHQLKATLIDPLEAAEQAAKAAGLAKADIVVLRDTIEAAVGDEKAAIFRPAVINEKGEPIAFYRDGGELKALRLADGDFGRQMYAALTGMTRSESNVFIEMLAKPAAVLRTGITAAPEFILANLIRDQVGAMVFYGKPFQRLASTVRGMGDELLSRDAARAYNQAGGIMGGANVASVSDVRLRHDLQALRKKGWVAERMTSLEGVLQATEVSETGMRLGLFKDFFKEARGRGLDEFEATMEAAYRARDHLDFNRRGSAMTGLSRLIPFLNAAMQGTDKTWRQMIAPLFGDTASVADSRARGDAVKAWARLSAITVGSMGLHALMSEHDEYLDLSTQTRATHWMVKWGDKWLAIPKPFEMAAVINIGEAAWDALARQDPRWAETYRQGLLEVTMPPNVMEGNPAIATAYEMASGHKLRDGTPIVPEGLEGMEPWLQFSAKTSELSKVIGKAINQSPAMIDHAITAHTGSLGRSVLALYDYALSDKPLPGWEDMPFTRRFIKDGSRGSSSTRAFWDLVSTRSGRLEGARKSYEAMIDGGDPGRAADFLAQQDGITRAWVTAGAMKADVRRIHPFARAQKAVTAINALRREISESGFDTAAGAKWASRVDRGAADDILEDLSMAEARNALVMMKVAGWDGREMIETAGYMRELQAINPDLAAALADRFATAKVLPLDAVERLWPEFEARLLKDGSDALVSDLAARAKAAGFEGDGKAMKRKPRAKVEGLQ